MDFTSVNYMAVVVAALAAVVFGFLVHGPLFGKLWISLMKITPKQMKEGRKKMEKKMPLYMLMSLIQQVVVAFVIALFVNTLSIDSIPAALMFSFWAWLGFVVTVHLNTVLWEERSVPLYTFNVVHQLASISIVTVILAMWR